MSKEIDRSLILNRLKEHYDFKSDSDFADFLGIKPQTLSSWHTRNSFDINLLYAKCVNVDGNFLLTGKGSIEKPNLQEKWSNKKTTKKTTFPEETKSSKNVVISEKPNIQNTLYNESIRKSIRFSDETKSTENLILSESPFGIPLIPIDAMAGFGTGGVQVMEYEVSRYVVPEFTELNVDFMIRVKGSSMYPKYNSGDIVACKKLVLQDVFFQWNKVYVLDTEQGALIKRIRKGKDEKHILVVSENQSYDPFHLPISKINAIALVCGVIRLE